MLDVFSWVFNDESSSIISLKKKKVAKTSLFLYTQITTGAF